MVSRLQARDKPHLRYESKHFQQVIFFTGCKKSRTLSCKAQWSANGELARKEKGMNKPLTAKDRPEFRAAENGKLISRNLHQPLYLSAPFQSDHVLSQTLLHNDILIHANRYNQVYSWYIPLYPPRVGRRSKFIPWIHHLTKVNPPRPESDRHCSAK